MSSRKVSNTNEKVKLEENFINEIISTVEGQRVLSCIQCGTCTATCPVNKVFGHSPRQIFLMVRNGMRQEVLSDLTPWVCASCYKCTVNCPAEIKITEVMYKLKRMSLQSKLVTKKSDTNLFYAAFLSQVLKYGRSHELGLMLKYMTFHHTLGLIKQMPLGMRMFMEGAMPVFPHKIKRLKEFEKIVSHAIKLEEKALSKQ
ncbi:MAG: 4Fe-4S dicluster domain-containing protein [Bacteroidetes bacterium]|nr:4Fe-4S dicluster domain-containing protein [Bacteroidota bacterium]